MVVSSHRHSTSFLTHQIFCRCLAIRIQSFDVVPSLPPSYFTTRIMTYRPIISFQVQRILYLHFRSSCIIILVEGFPLHFSVVIHLFMTRLMIVVLSLKIISTGSPLACPHPRPEPTAYDTSTSDLISRLFPDSDIHIFKGEDGPQSLQVPLATPRLAKTFLVVEIPRNATNQYLKGKDEDTFLFPTYTSAVFGFLWLYFNFLSLFNV